MKSCHLLLLVLSLWGISGFAAPEPTYYVVFSSYNGVTDKPSLSHSFVTFVRLNATRTEFSSQTISWLPDGEPVRALALQNGRNHSLEETMRIAAGKRITHLGPYRSTQRLYDLATERLKYLNGGRVKYKMFDWKTRKPTLQNLPGAINCIHAVSDMLGLLDAGEDAWGDRATLKVRDHFRGELVDYPRTFPEVLAWLHL